MKCIHLKTRYGDKLVALKILTNSSVLAACGVNIDLKPKMVCQVQVPFIAEKMLVGTNNFNGHTPQLLIKEN